MRFSTCLFAALLVLAYSAPADAVLVYLTPDQGFPFQTPDDPREVDTIGPVFGVNAGDPGPFLEPGNPTQRLNLWVDPEGETLTFLGLRLRTLSSAPFTDWSIGATLGATSPEDASAFGLSGTFFTISNIEIDGRCDDLGGFAGAPAGLGQGNCVGSGPGALIVGGDPDQTAPMLLGTLTMDLSSTSSSALVVEIVTGSLSSYIVMGQPEQFFGPQLLLASGTQTVFPAPEPEVAVLVGVGLLALLIARTCRRAWL